MVRLSPGRAGRSDASDVFRRRPIYQTHQRRALRHLHWSAPAVEPPGRLIIYIDGVEVTALAGSLQVTEGLGQAPTASWRMKITAAASPPSFGASVLIQDDGEPVFSGTIDEVGGAHTFVGDGSFISVGASGWRARLSRKYIESHTYTGQTLKAVAESIRSTYLATYGISMGVMSGVGPTITLTLTDTYADAALDDTVELAPGWYWTLSPGRELRVLQSGEVPAPFPIVNGVRKLNRLSWKYRNKQFVNGVVIGWTLASVEQTKKTATTGSYATDPQVHYEHIGESTSAVAQAYADAKLEELSINPRLLSCTTRHKGFGVGQTLTVNVDIDAETITGTFVITQSAWQTVAKDEDDGDWIEYTFEAQEQIGRRLDGWSWWDHRLTDKAVIDTLVHKVA